MHACSLLCPDGMIGGLARLFIGKPFPGDARDNSDTLKATKDVQQVHRYSGSEMA